MIDQPKDFPKECTVVTPSDNSDNSGKSDKDIILDAMYNALQSNDDILTAAKDAIEALNSQKSKKDDEEDEDEA